MRKTGALLGALALSATLAGCWEQAGFNAGRTYHNPDETTLTAATIDEAVQLWSTDLGTEPALNLLSANGKVFAEAETGTSHRTVGLAAGTGNVLWTYNAPHDPSFPLSTSNAVHTDGVLESAFSSGTVGGRQRINANTGAQISRTGALGNYGAHTLFRAGGEIGTMVSGNFPGGGGPVSAVRWKCDAAFTGSLGGRQAVVVGTNLMWSNGTQAWGYSDCNTSTRAWGSSRSTELGGTPISVAAVGDGAAYVDDTGTMTLVDATTGGTAWAVEVGTSAGRPAVAGGTIYLTPADGRLVAYSSATGAELWDADLGADGGSPVVAGDVIYTVVGSDIVAFDTDGNELTTIPVEGTVADDPIVDGGRLLVGTTDGRVVAFGLPG